MIRFAEWISLTWPNSYIVLKTTVAMSAHFLNDARRPETDALAKIKCDGWKCYQNEWVIIVNSKGHLYISLIKSAIRIIGCVLAFMNDSVVILAVAFLIATRLS